jgi:hypothetical protein
MERWVKKGVHCCPVTCRRQTSVPMFLLRLQKCQHNVQAEAAKPQASQNFTLNQPTSRDSSIWISFLLRPRTLKKQRTNTFASKKSTHLRKELRADVEQVKALCSVRMKTSNCGQRECSALHRHRTNYIQENISAGAYSCSCGQEVLRLLRNPKIPCRV